MWMQDNPAARATHEKGIKHKDNVAKKLRQMRMTADREVREKEMAASSMASIEARAQKQYVQDMQAAAQAQQMTAGSWALQQDSDLHYNAHHRYYYDRKTQMYYGGVPPAWTNDPPLPSEALYGAAGPVVTVASGGEKASSLQLTHSKADKHFKPLTKIGGYQMPSTGAIGGAKQLASSSQASTLRKRPRSAVKEKSYVKQQKLSPDEAAAVAKREAARARVQDRTMQAFGLT